MTALDLAAIQARADAATPGPWHVHSASMGIRGAGEPYAWVMTPDNAAVVERHNGGTVADAEFIAHARTDVPGLLARIAELEAERDAGFLELARHLATAEASGYERAVARLRDREAWAVWRRAHVEVALNAAPGEIYADYLEHEATKESTE